MTEKVLEVEGLKTQFFTQDGVVQAVDGLSFTVEAGEMVGIVGESGCGKSTAALSIIRLLPTQGKIVDGEIRLNGRDIVPLNERQVRSLRGPEVAMIFQDALAALDPTMKVGRQIMEPLQTHLGLSAQVARERTLKLLEMVGIPSPEERMDAYPHEFSGGMRQRVMIAIALSCNPKVLVADEPTTALDVTIQRQILDLMLQLRRESGAGVILITHDVGVVAETCDRVVVMYAGRAIESGPTEAVFKAPQHPYTIGLLNSTLDLHRNKAQPLEAISGLPPDLIQLPTGCTFHPRCLWQTEQCQAEIPSLESVGAGHSAACWHADKVSGGKASLQREDSHG
ncbi:MAG: ABC transporter ATP-binding protein [Chloroflexota bacterium]